MGVHGNISRDLSLKRLPAGSPQGQPQNLRTIPDTQDIRDTVCSSRSAHTRCRTRDLPLLGANLVAKGYSIDSKNLVTNLGLRNTTFCNDQGFAISGRIEIFKTNISRVDLQIRWIVLQNGVDVSIVKRAGPLAQNDVVVRRRRCVTDFALKFFCQRLIVDPCLRPFEVPLGIDLLAHVTNVPKLPPEILTAIATTDNGLVHRILVHKS